MLFKSGDKVHILHRQFFPSDAKRHFIGVIDACEDNLIRVKGHIYASDKKTNIFVPRTHKRTRVLAVDHSVIINLLPDSVCIEKISYTLTPNGEISISDGSSWHMVLTHL